MESYHIQKPKLFLSLTIAFIMLAGGLTMLILGILDKEEILDVIRQW